MKQRMKISLILSLFLILSSCTDSKKTEAANDTLQNNQISKDIRLPTKSQFSTITQAISTTDITIDYYRPNVNKRKIWGKVVKWDTIWRTGAERATVLYLKDDAIIEGKKVYKGKYSLFTIPRENGKWTVILNKDYNLFGIQHYKRELDALRFEVNVIDCPFTETLTFRVTDVKENSAIVRLEWETKAVQFLIEFDRSMAWNKIDEYVEANRTAADSLKWGGYIEIANYCVFSENKEKAPYCLKLINQSIKIKKDFENVKLKSDLFALMERNDSASFYAKIAHYLGSHSRTTPREVIDSLEVTINKYDSKIKK